MSTQLLEIQPREIKFIFELKKQSSCAVQLGNVTDQYVAFKVKTTSPKKYCVRPNVGIIKPKSTFDFTVTMQAQKSAPPEMQCKDKFLIQSTLVPFGTTEDDITPGMFVKDSKKYIEEVKLRVVLASAPSSPVNPSAVVKQEPSYESSTPKEVDSHVLLPVDGVTNHEPSYQTSMQYDKLQDGSETITKKVEPVKSVRFMEDFRLLKVTDETEKDELQPVKDADETKSKLTKDIEELRSKINVVDSNLVEAKHTIAKLRDEQRNTIREKEKLKEELAILRRTKSGARITRVGFPPLFVCMVALISLVIGSLFRALFRA